MSTSTWELVVSSVAARLSEGALSPKEIAIRSVDIASAVSREVELREVARYAGSDGDAAREELAARGASAGGG